MQPSPLTIIWSMLAATSLILGLMHAVLWLRRRRPAFAWAAVMAAASGLLALNELTLMHTRQIAPVAALLRQQNLWVAVVLVAMVWYVDRRLGTGRRWLAGTITALWAACLVVNFRSPSSLVFRSIDELRRLPTFWGEEFSVAVGPVHPFKYLADVASLLIMIYVIEASLRAWRRGQRRAAAVIGGSITFFIVAAGVHTPLVDVGLVPTPSMISVAFLAIVLALSWEITRDAARSRELGRELEQTRLELDRLARTNLLGEFASTLAHELNQPLTAVLANAQVARRYLTAEPPRVADAREMLELIIRDDKRAAEVIQRLHGLVARGEVLRAPLDLNAVVGETVELCRREASERGVALALDLEPQLPLVVAGRVELQQVVLNLLHNALQAVAPVTAGARRIQLATRSQADGVRFAIEDSGRGVPAAARASLFTPFQGDREGGVGMGLAICKRIVEAHGGVIRAEEVARGGARFVVDLPHGRGTGGAER